MKVLLTTDAVGGVWRHSLDLALGLTQAGAEVVLAVMGPPANQEQVQEARQNEALVLEQKPYQLEWMQESRESVAAAGRWLRRLAQQHDVDLVHSNSYAHGAEPFACPVVVAGHSCLLGWWRAVHGGPPMTDVSEYRRLVQQGLQGADLVVAPSRWMLQSLEEHYGPFSSKRAVVPNGRSPVAGPAPVKERVGLWVGRLWDEAKGARLLEEAGQRGHGWDIHMVGDPVHPESGQAIQLQGLHQTGRLSSDQLKERYAKSTFFVSTARYEPFGLGPLEAAQAGCTLVLPALESLQENWHDAALFYRPGDAEDLCRALSTLRRDPVACAGYARQAQAKAAGMTHHAMARAYLGHYQELVESRRTDGRHKGKEVESCMS